VCEREREREREREDLVIFQIKFQKLIIKILNHVGQALQILHWLTIESNNLHRYRINDIKKEM
jgi:hypothetical protein